MRSATALLVCTAVTAAVLAAQQDAGPESTFRAGTDLLRMDVSVLDKNRHPVRGLTAADFTVLEDGQPRPIAAFTAIDLPPVLKTTATWARDVVPDVATNVTPDEGRLVVILLDRSIPAGEPTIAARRIATAAIDALSPTDLAAVTFTRNSTPQDFTADRKLLGRAINGNDPGAADSDDASVIASSLFTSGECYCGICVPEGIERIALALRDSPRRKLLLFIGSATILQQGDNPGDRTLDCQFRLKQAREKMERALNASNVTVHSFNPTGLQPILAPPAFIARALQANIDRDSSIRALPDITGGRTVANTNDAMRLVPQIFEESDSYYLIGFRPGPGAGNPSRPRKIEVKVNRKGLDVRSRREYAPEAAIAATAPTPGAPPAGLARAMMSALPDPGWPLTATAAPFAIPGQRDPGVLVVTGVRHDVDAPAATGTAPRTERVDVLSQALDARARPRGADGRTLDVTFAAAGDGALEYEVFSRLSLRPGHYEIRTAASNGTRSGSVITYLDVPDFAGDPLSLSGLVLDAAPTAASAPRDLVAGWLPVLPTTRRTFQPGDRVGAFLRVYQGGKALLASTAIDARIVDANDSTVFSDRISKASDLFAINRSVDYRLDLPLARLPSGEYLLTVEATAGTHVARRDLRFSVTTAPAPSGVVSPGAPPTPARDE